MDSIDGEYKGVSLEKEEYSTEVKLKINWTIQSNEMKLWFSYDTCVSEF